jgi:hypothetical protein
MANDFTLSKANELEHVEQPLNTWSAQVIGGTGETTV